MHKITLHTAKGWLQILVSQVYIHYQLLYNFSKATTTHWTKSSRFVYCLIYCSTRNEGILLSVLLLTRKSRTMVGNGYTLGLLKSPKAFWLCVLFSNLLFLSCFLVVVPRNRRQRRAIIEDLQASADFTEFEPNYESPLIRNSYEQIPSSVVNEEAPALQRTGIYEKICWSSDWKESCHCPFLNIFLLFAPVELIAYW